MSHELQTGHGALVMLEYSDRFIVITGVINRYQLVPTPRCEPVAAWTTDLRGKGQTNDFSVVSLDEFKLLDLLVTTKVVNP